MARFKKFSGGTSISEFEPINFNLNEHSFTAKSAIPGAVLLEFVRDAAEDSAAALYNFLEAALPASEYSRLQKILRDPEVIIEVTTIGEIVAWLVEEYAARPTKQPEDFSTGQSTSGPTSMAGHSYQE